MVDETYDLTPENDEKLTVKHGRSPQFLSTYAEGIIVANNPDSKTVSLVFYKSVFDPKTEDLLKIPGTEGEYTLDGGNIIGDLFKEDQCRITMAIDDAKSFAKAILRHLES